MNTWWGTCLIAEGRAHCWRIGALNVRVENLMREWRFIAQWDRDPLDPRADLEEDLPLDGPTPAPELGERGRKVHRFAAVDGEDHVRVDVLLADRPVVVRPEVPFHVLAGDTARVYVSTPVWLRFSTAKGQLLLDLPSFRPSDTWYGSSTRDGELCYSSLTHARLLHEELVVRANRAITELTLINRGKSPLLMERIKVPVPHLQVLHDPNGGLWTRPITATRVDEDDALSVVIGEVPHVSVGKLHPLGKPRASGRVNVLVRAMTALVG